MKRFYPFVAFSALLALVILGLVIIVLGYEQFFSIILCNPFDCMRLPLPYDYSIVTGVVFSLLGVIGLAFLHTRRVIFYITIGISGTIPLLVVLDFFFLRPYVPDGGCIGNVYFYTKSYCTTWLNYPALLTGLFLASLGIVVIAFAIKRKLVSPENEDQRKSSKITRLLQEP